MPKFITVDEFAAGAGHIAGIRTEGASVDLANSTGRLVSYVLSDTSVGRDNHVIAANAWQIDNFLRNPVMPWAHDTSQPPIAKWVDIASRGARLVGTAEYADRDTYPFADTIFRLVKGGFLNAVSTGWIPLEWKFSTDRSRPGGVDFSKVDLLEVSQVPVPALPTALVTARAQGIDTAPLVEWAERMLDGGDLAVLPRHELETLRREAKMPSARKPAREPGHDWKVSVSRTLPLDEQSSWDAAAAETAIFESCGFGGDNPDLSLARKAFLVFDASAPKLRTSYRMPIAKVVDGRLSAVAAGIRAAGGLLAAADIPDDVRRDARKAIDDYEARMAMLQPARIAGKRSLSHVGWLAMLLNELGYLQDCTEYEAAIEEDGSQIPAQLLEAMKSLGQVLIAMTVEEVSELLGGDDEEDNVDDVVVMASDIEIKRNAFRMMRRLDVGALAAVAGAMRQHILGRNISFTIGDKVTEITRAGKVLSAENERCLREAHDHMTKAVDMVRSVVDKNDDDDQTDDDDDNNDDDTKRATRLRRAKALKLKIAQG